MVVTPQHCLYCFDVLEAHFESRPPMKPDFENSEYPLFVTWEIIQDGHTRLRGCIGNFEALPLHSGLKQYALTSALHDRRFNPISLPEIEHLTCGVSLLTDFEEATSYIDWQVGVHGIWIEFVDDSGRKKTATYLPEVPPEQGWTKIDSIDSLLRKGGFRGKITDRVRERIKLTRYQSRKYVLTYDEYVEMKQKKSWE